MGVEVRNTSNLGDVLRVDIAVERAIKRIEKGERQKIFSFQKVLDLYKQGLRLVLEDLGDENVLEKFREEFKHSAVMKMFFRNLVSNDNFKNWIIRILSSSGLLDKEKGLLYNELLSFLELMVWVRKTGDLLGKNIKMELLNFEEGVIDKVQRLLSAVKQKFGLEDDFVDFILSLVPTAGDILKENSTREKRLSDKEAFKRILEAIYFLSRQREDGFFLRTPASFPLEVNNFFSEKGLERGWFPIEDEGVNISWEIFAGQVNVFLARGLKFLAEQGVSFEGILSKISQEFAEEWGAFQNFDPIFGKRIKKSSAYL